jgi:hypothetical protein
MQPGARRVFRQSRQTHTAVARRRLPQSLLRRRTAAGAPVATRSQLPPRRHCFARPPLPLPVLQCRLSTCPTLSSIPFPHRDPPRSRPAAPRRPHPPGRPHPLAARPRRRPEARGGVAADGAAAQDLVRRGPAPPPLQLRAIRMHLHCPHAHASQRSVLQTLTPSSRPPPPQKKPGPSRTPARRACAPRCAGRGAGTTTRDGASTTRAGGATASAGARGARADGARRSAEILTGRVFCSVRRPLAAAAASVFLHTHALTQIPLNASRHHLMP